MLEEREAFLRAIFDAPDDDLPRLVYADWLEEHHQLAHAGLIRIQCELARLPPGKKPTSRQYSCQARLIREVNGIDRPPATAAFPNRGFRNCEELQLTVNDLNDAAVLRGQAVVRCPEWFGATRFRLTTGILQTSEQAATLLESSAFSRVNSLDLSGSLTALPGRTLPMLLAVLRAAPAPTNEFRYEPRINLRGLTSLLGHSGIRRITRLDLSNNDLDNDAIRVLADSPHLLRLKELCVGHGNRFRGRVWQQLIERFGQDVVN